MPSSPQAVRVVVAGGGIAGMTTALRLAERGYQVTLYEAKPWLGGNLSSHRDEGSGVYHDVYPHMFSNFYVNFWEIVEKDLGMRRDASPESDFAVREGLQTLTHDGGWKRLRNPTSLDPAALISDLRAGVSGMSAADMYLYLYSLLDLIVHRFDVRGMLGASLNDYIRSRPCSTERVALLHDQIVMFIWSIHSTATSAASYKSFYRHAYGNTRPMLWLLKGSLAEKIIMPLEQRLEKLGCTVKKGVMLHSLTVDQGRVTNLEFRVAKFNRASHELSASREVVPTDPFDHVVLALPPDALGEVADRGPVAARQLTAVMPKLAHAGKRLPTEPIAVMDLYITRRLPNFPDENIMALDSDCYFSIIDLSQLWPQLQAEENLTALTLASSDYWALPSDSDRHNAHHLILELHSYVGGFNPGKHWGDPEADIDWKRSHFHSNKDEVIFVNQVGSWAYRPKAHSPAVENLFFAGDFCRNHVDMATVEAAVTSGLNAAAALQAAAPMGEPIVALKSPMWSLRALCTLKMLLAPSAYAAKAVVTLGEIAAGRQHGDPHVSVPHRLTTLWSLPAAYVVDMAETAASIWVGSDDDRTV